MKIQCVECLCATLHATTGWLNRAFEKWTRRISHRSSANHFIFLFRLIQFSKVQLLSSAESFENRSAFHSYPCACVSCHRWLCSCCCIHSKNIVRNAPTTGVHHEPPASMRTIAVETDTLDCLTVEMKIRENNLVTDDYFRLSKMGFQFNCNSVVSNKRKKNGIDKAFSISFLVPFFLMRLCSSSWD